MKTTAQRFSAVQQAMSQAGIAKESKNQMQKYLYRGIDAVMNTLAPILAEQEIMILPSVKKHKYTTGKTKNGGVSFHHFVQVEYSVYSAAHPDVLGPFTAHGECIDTSDKGLNKACTAAFKYWVLTALCVPLEGQEDADSVTPAEHGAAAASPEQIAEIAGLIKKSNTDIRMFEGWLNIESITALTEKEYQKAKTALNRKLDTMSETYEQGEKQAALEEEGRRLAEGDQ